MMKGPWSAPTTLGQHSMQHTTVIAALISFRGHHGSAESGSELCQGIVGSEACSGCLWQEEAREVRAVKATTPVKAALAVPRSMTARAVKAAIQDCEGRNKRVLNIMYVVQKKKKKKKKKKKAKKKK
eukprot:NODE_11594_length_1276_cov_4.847694.p3 GENE.NODE_11594_length_1276_cov_4.847694~~NODE_11594_length_1276_cov_4.847694.p3  ORF type:complete len:127 (-),score=47.41 NODE_11594_length_1276_cov_4.847694:38-418(-)